MGGRRGQHTDLWLSVDSPHQRTRSRPGRRDGRLVRSDVEGWRRAGGERGALGFDRAFRGRFPTAGAALAARGDSTALFAADSQRPVSRLRAGGSERAVRGRFTTAGVALAARGDLTGLFVARSTGPVSRLRAGGSERAVRGEIHNGQCRACGAGDLSGLFVARSTRTSAHEGAPPHFTAPPPPPPPPMHP